MRGNEIEVELELNLGILEPEQTGGWIESHFDIVDKISAAKRPSDTSAYTHKLNFEWDTALLAPPRRNRRVTGLCGDWAAETR